MNEEEISEPFAHERREKLMMATEFSLSPKAGYNKASRSDFRSQRFESDTGRMQKMRNKGLRRCSKKRGKCGHENAENVLARSFVSGIIHFLCDVMACQLYVCYIALML